MSSKQHSLRDLQEDYEGAVGVIGKYRTKMLGIIDTQAAQKLVKEFEEKALGALVKVSESAINVADRKGLKKQDMPSREKEDFAHKYGNAVAKRIDPEHGGFLSMEEMLDEVIRLEAEILSRGSIRIPVRIFSPKGSGSIVTGNGGGMEESKTAPKYESLVRILAKRSIDISGLMVGVETLEKSQMRKVPYRVVWMKNPLRTICISDEVGEKTYVYHGFADIAGLAAHEKGESIRGGVPAVGVMYSDAYEIDLERAIFDEDVSLVKDNQIIPDKPPLSIPEFVPNAEVLIYQSMLMAHEEDLVEAGIIQENGVWYFGDAKGMDNWPKIDGKTLRSFPSGTFNKTNSIGDYSGAVRNGKELSKLFSTLGFRIATEQEEKIRWAKMLIDSKMEFLKVGIIYEDGVWYFEDMGGMKGLPRIRERSLRSYPNAEFNKMNGIGDKKGTIESRNELSGMFAILGLRIATEEEQQVRWMKMLINTQNELAEAGIIYEDNIWYFGDAKGRDSWPEIKGRKLGYLTSPSFLKNHDIGGGTGKILSVKELSRMFSILGLRVATEEEQEARWAKMLVDAQVQLADAGITYEDGIWYFGDAKGWKDWPNIEGRNLINFPNGLFNQAHKIGNSTGSIRNKEELSNMFATLGLRVLSEEEQKKRWTEDITNMKEEFMKIGIDHEDGVWYFENAKGMDSWPKVKGKWLSNYPNSIFNKSHGIGGSKGTITNVKELAKMFAVLGLRVATEKEINGRKTNKPTDNY